MMEWDFQDLVEFVFAITFFRVKGEDFFVGEEEVCVSAAEFVHHVRGVSGCQGCPQLSLLEEEVVADAFMHETAFCFL